MAHSLNMDVTEGIETVEKTSLALHATVGKDISSRPLKSEAVEVLLATEPHW